MCVENFSGAIPKAVAASSPECRRLNGRRNDQWSTIFVSLDPEDQSSWRLTKQVVKVLTPPPP